jgi:predicted dinucleotide-binding enzyme
MGKALGRLFVRGGHDVLIGSREPAKGASAAAALGGGARGGTIREAAEHGDAVLLAVHFAIVREAIVAAGPLTGKVVIDCGNPLTADFMGLTVGFTTSAAEQLAAMVPGAKVVKAFNHNLSAALGALEGTPSGEAGFYCGDDASAKALVATLIGQVGLNPIDAGPLTNARYLEPLAQLEIQLAYKMGLGPRVGVALLVR